MEREWNLALQTLSAEERDKWEHQLFLFKKHHLLQHLFKQLPDSHRKPKEQKVAKERKVKSVGRQISSQVSMGLEKMEEDIVKRQERKERHE